MNPKLSTSEADVPDAQQLADALRHIVERLGRRLRSDWTEDSIEYLGVGYTYIAALATLNNAGSISPSALAKREMISPPSVTRVVDLLENRGFVERVENPNDGRQSVIKTTSAGRRLIQKGRMRRSASLAESLESINHGELKLLHDAFELLTRLYDL